MTSCKSCGQEIPAEMKFCGHCGVPKSVAETAANPEPVKSIPVSSAPIKRTIASQSIEVLLWLALVGTLFGLVILGFSPHGEGTTRTPNTSWIFLPLWCYLIARVRRLNKPWRYAVGGLVLAFVVIAAGGLVSGLRSRSAGNELLQSISEFDPAAGAAAKAAVDDASRQKVMALADVPPLSVAERFRVFRHCNGLGGQLFCVLGGRQPAE